MPNSKALQVQICNVLVERLKRQKTGEAPYCEKKDIDLESGQKAEKYLMGCGMRTTDDEEYYFFGRGRTRHDVYLYTCLYPSDCQPTNNLNGVIAVAIERLKQIGVPPKGDTLPKSDTSQEGNTLPKSNKSQEGNTSQEGDTLPKRDTSQEDDTLPESDT